MISSTALDLPEHRRAAKEACLCREVLPCGMEELPARDATGVRASLEMVDTADVFIGIYAHRYGWIPEGSGTSITEMEFDRAVERNIPILLFYMDEEHLLTVKQIEFGDQARRRLAEFKTRACRGRVRAEFKSPDDLKGKIIQALAELEKVRQPSGGEERSEPDARARDGGVIDGLPQLYWTIGSMLAVFAAFVAFAGWQLDRNRERDLREVHGLLAEMERKLVEIHPSFRRAQTNAHYGEDILSRVRTGIAVHADRPSIAASLRVQQAMAFLSSGQLELAREAFDKARLEDLHGKERCLKQLQDVLLWWWSAAGGSLSRTEHQVASNALARISSVRAALTNPDDESTRDWLAGMRAWIALKMANDADDTALGEGTARSCLEDSLNTFAAMLPPGETVRWGAVGNWPSGPIVKTAADASSRRRLQAEELTAGARLVMRQNAIREPRIDDPFLRSLLIR